MGGENEFDTRTNAHAWGSSPRGRGKLPHDGALAAGGRLIPAWAGKTRDIMRSMPADQAHPRVGGENRRQGLE